MPISIPCGYPAELIIGLCDDVPYLLWHGSIAAYKSFKMWVVRLYITNGLVTINNIDYISHYICSVGYASLQDILYI